LSTYIFAWNPKLWGWPELPDDIARLRRRGHIDIEWACGRTRAIEPGSRAFFVRLGVPPKGLIGSGYTMTAPVTRAPWRREKLAKGGTTNYLWLRLEYLTDTPLILFDELARPPFSRFRWAVRQSGMRLPSSIADVLEPWWEERVQAAPMKRERATTRMAADIGSAAAKRAKPAAAKPAKPPAAKQRAAKPPAAKPPKSAAGKPKRI
jgi:5-methylcytosine-specific restriction protein A